MSFQYCEMESTLDQFKATALIVFPVPERSPQLAAIPGTLQPRPPACRRSSRFFVANGLAEEETRSSKTP